MSVSAASSVCVTAAHPLPFWLRDLWAPLLPSLHTSAFQRLSQTPFPRAFKHLNPSFPKNTTRLTQDGTADHLRDEGEPRYPGQVQICSFNSFMAPEKTSPGASSPSLALLCHRHKSLLLLHLPTALWSKQAKTFPKIF